MLVLHSLSLYAGQTAPPKDTVLDARQQSIVSIAAFTANGQPERLEDALHAGLDAGLTISEIKEVIVQMYAYAGFPRSLNGLHTFMDVLKERSSKGIRDAAGREASPYPAGKTALEFGTENQTKLVGAPVKGEVYEFAPVIDRFLKEHLFGHIFGRDILDYKTREIATIAALASLEGTDNQLRSHFRVGMHNGLTKDNLHQIVGIIRNQVGKTAGDRAAGVLQGVLEPGKPTVSAGSSNSNFVGTVSATMMVTPDSVFNTQLGSVTFAPSARTNWHYHPSGQILVITEGTAYYQEKGKPKQILTKGQVVKCPPGVHHWHGASPHGSMTHLAMTPDLSKGGVVWLDAVTDETYNSAHQKN
jgi:alkylhydroperoxidase/carboxymuconolactone decarboxylase family protein YurZ/quercetin dioxygenase-like cupin family protein